MNLKLHARLLLLQTMAALTLLFLTLRLIGVIAWPYIWITVPTWGPLALTLAYILIAALADCARKPGKPKYQPRHAKKKHPANTKPMLRGGV